MDSEYTEEDANAFGRRWASAGPDTQWGAKRVGWTSGQVYWSNRSATVERLAALRPSLSPRV